MDSFNYFFGIVEDRYDPEQLGRCKVRIFGVHSENKEELPTSDLPWAYPILPVNNAAMSGMGESVTGPVEGTQVFGFFRDGDDKQEPMILGTVAGKYDKKPIYSEGFADPSGKYPVFDVDKNDVNRLERGVIEKTHVDFKLQNLTTAQIISDISETGERIVSTWEEMFETSPNYPFNHVYETESGHMQEFDDTPGFERIHKMHRTGTSEEVYANGDKTVKVYGNQFEVVIEDNNVAIYGNCNITIGDNANILIGGNANMEVNGNLSYIVHGDEHKIVYGNSTERVSGSITRVAGANIQDKASNINIHSSGNLVTRAGGYNYMQASGNAEIQGSIVHIDKPTPLVDIFNEPALASSSAISTPITPTDLKDYSPRKGQTMARTYISIDPESTNVTDITTGETTVQTKPEGFVYPISNEASTDEDEIIRRVIRREGGYVNNPNDRGGPTKYGITIKALATWRGVNVSTLTPSDVKLLKEDEAIQIYKKNYWVPSKATQLPENVRELYFDTYVNGGGVNVCRRAMNALGVSTPLTGGMDSSLIKAMNSVNSSDLYNAMVKSRVQRYYDIVSNNPTQKVFINGWLNRMKEFGWSTDVA